MPHFLPLLCLAVALTACTRAGSSDPDPVALHSRASTLAAAGDLPAAYSTLQDSLRGGYPTPSDVLRSDDWRPLLDDAHYRRQLRELLKANARESTLTMTRPDEPGEPLRLTIRIIDERDDRPLPGALVKIVHTDAAGFYQPWDAPEEELHPKIDISNPRLFAFAVTDESGRIVVTTIRPGHYAPEYESDEEPAHVHFNIELEGYRPYNSEILFEDDPRLVGDGLREAKEHQLPIASVQRELGIKDRWRVTIGLQAMP